jgi:lysozyme family protein
VTTLADIQRRVGVAPDGVWGPNTARAIWAALPAIQAPPPVSVFDRALAVILKHEGGFVNHPKDACHSHAAVPRAVLGRGTLR